jgi:hypothetical protein
LQGPAELMLAHVAPILPYALQSIGKAM